MQPRPSPALMSILGIQFMGGLGYGLIFPIAALYGEAAGLSPASITFLVALHPLMRLLFGRVWGRASDHWGRRPVLLLGIALQCLGHLFLGLGHGAWALGLARSLTGLGSAESVAAWAAVGDLTRPEDRAWGLGLMRAASGLGMLSGPLLGGALGLIDLHWAGLAAALGCALSLGFVWRFVPETRPIAAPQSTPTVDFRVPVVMLVVAAASAGAMALAEAIVPLAIEHVLVPHLALPDDWPAPKVALILTVGVVLAWGLTTALFDGALSARWVGRLGPKTAVLGGLGLWAVAFLCTPAVYQMEIIVGAGVIACTAIPASLVGVGLSTWISRLAGPHGQGRAVGATQSAIALGEFMGPALSGWLYGYAYGLPYQVGAGFLVLAALWMAIRPPTEVGSEGSR